MYNLTEASNEKFVVKKARGNEINDVFIVTCLKTGKEEIQTYPRKMGYAASDILEDLE